MSDSVSSTLPQARAIEEHASAAKMVQTLLESPSTWVRWLVNVSEDIRSDPDMASGTLGALGAAVRTADDKTWSAVWRTGFVSKLARLIGNKYWCGYSREDLTSWEPDDEGILHVITNFLDLMSDCCQRLPVQPPSDPVAARELDIVLDILEIEYPAVFKNIWDMCDETLLLTSDASCSCKTRGDPEHEGSFHNNLSMFAILVYQELKARRQVRIELVSSYIPHVLLINWIYCHKQEQRSLSLRVLQAMLCQETPRDLHGKIQYPFESKSTSREKITISFMRDLKDPRIMDHDLRALIESILRMYPRIGVAKWRVLVEVLQGCLAAARRQLCLGQNPTESNKIVGLLYLFFDSMFTELPAYQGTMKEEVHLSLEQSYGMLAVTAKHVLELIEGRADAPSDLVRAVIRHCVASLRNHDPATEGAKTAAIRRHTQATWQASVSGDAGKGADRQHKAQWRYFMVLWRSVGDVLWLPRRDEETSPFRVLKRCHWVECLCSVHKPAHGLKVCTGCWLAAYCGSQCQESDWKKGGHRNACRRRLA